MTSFPELTFKDCSSNSENNHCSPNDLKSVQKNLFDVLADCFCP